MTYVIGIGLLAFQVALAVHVVRTGRPITWVFIILIFPLVGSLIYLFGVAIPEWERNNTLQNIVQRWVGSVKRFLSGEPTSRI